MKDNASHAGVRIEQEGEVLTFHLANPDAGNEITGTMFDAMLARLRAEATHPTARVLRVRAEGDSFCTGRERAGRDAVSIRAEVERLVALKHMLRESLLISVAEVQGAAAGFGAGLAILCDFTVAADTAVFSFPEMRKGLPPAAILAYLGTYALPKRVFPLVLLGRDFSAAHARDIGLVSEVVAPAALAATVDTLVADLLAMDAEGSRQCKAFFLQAQSAPVEANFSAATDLLVAQTVRLQARTA